MMNQKIEMNIQDVKLRKSGTLTSALFVAIFLFSLIGDATGFNPRNNVKASSNPYGNPYQAAVLLIKTTTSLATERGLAYTAMHSKGPISDDISKLIESNRKDAEENYKLAIEYYEAQHKVELSQPKYNNAQLLQVLDDLRPSIDQQLAVDLSQRDLSLADGWFNRATEAIESIDRLSRFVNQEISKVDPTLRRILMLQRSALMMREQVGLERAILSSAAEGAELRFSQLAILRDYRIVQSRFTDVVDLTARDAINDPTLASALSKANIAVHDTYSEGRSKMLETDGGGYPVSASVWFEQATQAIDTLDDLIIAIVDHAQNKLAAN